MTVAYQAYQFLTRYRQRIAPSGIYGFRKALLWLILQFDT